jgi:O-antigen/teichoic acid export membrane protein
VRCGPPRPLACDRLSTVDQAKRPSLTRQVGALASGSLAGQVGAVLLYMGLARVAPKSELGGYQQLQLIYGILSPLLIAGIPAALLYYVPRAAGPAEVSAWVGQAYVLLGGLGLLVTIGIAAGHVPLAAALGNPALATPLLIYAPQPFFAFVSAAMSTALVAAGRAGIAAGLGALSGAAALFAVLGAALIEPNTAHMAAGLVVASASTAIVATAVAHRTIGITLVHPRLRAGVVSLLGYGVPLALTGLAGRLAWQFDRLVVSRRFSAAEFAVYAIGAVELPITAIIQQSVNAVLVPALARLYALGDIVGMAALWRRAIRRSSLLLLPTFVFFMLTADATIALLFGPGFRDSVGVFRIYLLLVPVRVATYGLITQAIGRTRINLSGSIILLAANAVLVIALVGPLGLSGAALGTVLATLVLVVYYLIRLRGVLGMPIHLLFPWRLLAVNMAISALAGIPVALLLLAGVHGVVLLVLAAVLYVPTYLALLLLTRRLDPGEIEWVRSAARMVPGVPERWLAPGARDASG